MIEYIVSNDLETTGFNPLSDCWITGSFGLHDFETVETIKEIDLTARPWNWSDEAYEVHKIRKDVAMKFPDRGQALDQIVEFVPPREKFLFLCHANPQNFGNFFHFDFAFLKMDFVYQYDIHTFWRYFDDSNVISTHTFAKRLSDAGKLPLKRFGLADLCDHFEIPLDHHNAKSDRLAMVELYRRLRELEQIRTTLV